MCYLSCFMLPSPPSLPCQPRLYLNSGDLVEHWRLNLKTDGCGSTFPSSLNAKHQETPEHCLNITHSSSTVLSGSPEGEHGEINRRCWGWINRKRVCGVKPLPDAPFSLSLSFSLSSCCNNTMDSRCQDDKQTDGHNHLKMRSIQKRSHRRVKCGLLA